MIPSTCYLHQADRMSQRFCREAMAWSTLRHPNVLPLLGVTMAEGRLVMVSEWMVNGNINEFLRNNCADRLELVSASFGSSLLLLANGYVIAVAPGCR